MELPGLELTAGEVFRSCQSWTLYHCATKLRHFLQLKFLIKNASTGKTVVYTILTVFFTLVLLLSFSLSQHCCDIRYFSHYPLINLCFSVQKIGKLLKHKQNDTFCTIFHFTYVVVHEGKKILERSETLVVK